MSPVAAFRSSFTIAVTTIALAYLSFTPVALAALNPQLNYQAKLTDTSNVSVADGSYNVRFKLYTSASGGAPIWTEIWCYSPDSGSTCNGSGSDSRIAVANGLFSTLLGSTTPITSVDFDQTLYLGVEIGGSGTSPAWDGEMSPRKKLGAVPAALVAKELKGNYTATLGTTTSATTTNLYAASITLSRHCSRTSRHLDATRAPHGELAQPCTSAGEHEVAEVRAGDDQHQPDERHERHPEPAHGGVLVVGDRRHGLCAPRAIRGADALATESRRKKLVEPLGDGLDFRRCRGDRHLRCEAAKDGEPSIVSCCGARRRRPGGLLQP